jgi:hypothetical protein
MLFSVNLLRLFFQSPHTDKINERDIKELESRSAREEVFRDGKDDRPGDGEKRKDEIMNYDTAKRCFSENIRLFAPAQSQPEKFNHYNGLFNLTEGIEADQNSIKYLFQEILNELRRK